MASMFVFRPHPILWAGVLATAGSGFGAEPVAPSNAPPGYVAEAPLPEGFPPPSEPGKIVEKTYPPSRTYSASGKNAFFKCFSYLSLQRHEMTAPVLMDLRAGAAETGKSPSDVAERMHFVLERPTLDKPGKKLLVEVADQPKTDVVSIAVHGDLTAEKLAATERELRAYVKGKPALEVSGELRVLGYNSPMVEAEKRFWEVQLPVTPR